MKSLDMKTVTGSCNYANDSVMNTKDARATFGKEMGARLDRLMTLGLPAGGMKQTLSAATSPTVAPMATPEITRDMTSGVTRKGPQNTLDM